jgi:hypothetical protein
MPAARKSIKREAGNPSRQTPIQPDTHNTAAGDHGGHGKEQIKGSNPLLAFNIEIPFRP